VDKYSLSLPPTSFLSVISVRYISIYVKVRRSRHPQHHVADGLKERRLTSTLFL
ncbi:unnamed protein product, partial [Pocillopora meandrina]